MKTGEYFSKACRVMRLFSVYFFSLRSAFAQNSIMVNRINIPLSRLREMRGGEGRWIKRKEITQENSFRNGDTMTVLIIVISARIKEWKPC
ncbi:MAG: hypothetical protein LBI16_05685 [Burkholderiales bacterium]|jgi:hypothetical protein|nr:hypothetical protein [Burkholderiales bacterium]